MVNVLFKMASKQITSFGLLVILVQAISGQQRCRTPSGPLGQCTQFELCDSLYQLVNKGQQLSPDVHNLIVNSRCDPLNGEQMICCPMEQSRQINNDPSVSDQQAMDYTTHPNARLLDFRQCGKSSSDKIANGLTTQPFEFPWMAILRTVSENKLAAICGGSLITKRYVLTAAHCLQTVKGIIPIHSVVLGEHNTLTEPDCTDADDCADPIQEISIEQQIPHPQFSIAAAKNDIGLLRLSRDAQLSDSVTPVCLPYTIESQNLQLNKVIVTGWGVTEKKAPAVELLKAILDVTPNSKCSSIYKKRYFDRIKIDSTSICAFGGQMDSCSGDSGGPAVFIGPVNRLGPRVFQYGLVSAGTANCGSNYGIPGLYTRVTSYMQWILDNISD